jgi:hypothetical protein
MLPSYQFIIIIIFLNLPIIIFWIVAFIPIWILLKIIGTHHVIKALLLCKNFEPDE